MPNDPVFSDIGDPAYRIYAVLQSLRGDDGDAVVTQAELHRLTGKSLTTIRRALRELKEAGYITLYPTRAGSTNSPTRYRLHSKGND